MMKRRRRERGEDRGMMKGGLKRMGIKKLKDRGDRNKRAQEKGDSTGGKTGKREITKQKSRGEKKKENEAGSLAAR